MEEKYTRKYWHDKQVPYLINSYGFSEKVAEKVFERNWNYHHSSLFELEDSLDCEADYAEEIINSYLAD